MRGFRQAFKVTGRVAKKQSAFQEIEIVDTETLGRTLILDNTVQTSLRDEFLYHEMLVHPALTALNKPKRVLVIGGGDGGALRHVLMHPSVKRAVMVEIDGDVVDLCREHMPQISAGAFDDPRAELIIGDGAKFMAETDERFDAVIVDSTDPVGPAEILFATSFYENVSRVLTDRGIVATQSGSPFLMVDELKRAHTNMSAVFPVVRLYISPVFGYPGIVWCYLAGSRSTDLADVSRRKLAKHIDDVPTRMYTPDFHRGAFSVPPAIAGAVAGEKGSSFDLFNTVS